MHRAARGGSTLRLHGLPLRAHEPAPRRFHGGARWEALTIVSNEPRTDPVRVEVNRATRARKDEHARESALSTASVVAVSLRPSPF